MSKNKIDKMINATIAKFVQIKKVIFTLSLEGLEDRDNVIYVHMNID